MKAICQRLVLTAWSVTLFGFTALGQPSNDDVGVIVDTGFKLLHRPPLRYLQAANPGDLVVLSLSINAKGEVTDASVVSGPEELRKSALASVLQWHYDTTGGNAPVSVRASIQFRERAADTVPPSGPRQAKKRTGFISDIRFVGLPAELEQRAREALPVHVGDVYSADSLSRTILAMRKVDTHLSVAPTDSSAESGRWMVALQIELKSDPR